MRSSARPAYALLLAAATAALIGPTCASTEKRIRAEKRSASHLALAQRLMEQRRLQEALSQVDLAIGESKKNADAWLVRGQIEFALGEYQDALRDFGAALKWRPGYTEARSWRAWALAESGDPQGAEEEWRAALEDRTYPTPEKIHLNLGLLYFKMRRDAEALASLRQAVAVNPAYARGHYELGKALDGAGNVKSALASYEAALGGMKDSVDLNLRLAIALERSGEGARAREHFKRVIELSPEGPEAAAARDHLKRLDAAS